MSGWELSSTHEELFKMAMKAEKPLEAIRKVGAWVAMYRQDICNHQYQSDGRCAFCWRVKP